MALLEILNIIGGLVLAVGIVGALPGVGKYLEKAGKWLGGFQGIIGVIAIIFGIWGLLF